MTETLVRGESRATEVMRVYQPGSIEDLALIEQEFIIDWDNGPLDDGDFQLFYEAIKR